MLPQVKVWGHLFPINITSSSKCCFGQFNIILNSSDSMPPPLSGSNCNSTCPQRGWRGVKEMHQAEKSCVGGTQPCAHSWFKLALRTHLIETVHWWTWYLNCRSCRIRRSLLPNQGESLHPAGKSLYLGERQRCLEDALSLLEAVQVRQAWEVVQQS